MNSQIHNPNGINGHSIKAKKIIAPILSPKVGCTGITFEYYFFTLFLKNLYCLKYITKVLNNKVGIQKSPLSKGDFCWLQLVNEFRTVDWVKLEEELNLISVLQPLLVSKRS